MAGNRWTGDAFLQEQLELLRKLNERVSKLQDDVNHNVELIARSRREAERWRRAERVYRQRSSENDTSLSPEHERRQRITTASDAYRPAASAYRRRAFAERKERGPRQRQGKARLG